MSKISNLLLLFDKNRKQEAEKKDSLNIEKVRSAPLNKIIQKPDISQTKNNNNTNKQTQNNTIGDKMKMFEKKEEKITLTNKQKSENMKKEEKKEENKNISNITKKASMFEKTNNQA